MARDLHQQAELKPLFLPSLAYYLKLLELPNLELQNLIEAEVDTNPLIEDIEPVEVQTGETERRKEEINEFDILDLYAGATNISYEGSEVDEQFDPIDNIPAHNDRLYDHLMRQAERKFTGRELEIAELIIANLEEDGYLAVSPEDLCQEGYGINEIQKVRREIQFFDPPGCACCKMKESFLAQLEKLGFKEDSIEYIIVRDYLNNFINNQFKEIIRKFNIDETRINEIKRVMMKLDPRPGLRYSSTTPGYIIPDFIISWQDDRLTARINDDNMPRLRIKTQYLEKIKNPNSLSREELEFIKKKLNSAQNLIIAIEQRRKTLSKIVNELLECQKEFFLKGQNYLKSITMVEFAKRLGVNPSTVSRAVANKYIESPCGIHRMRYFFSTLVSKTDRNCILEKIKEIINNEDKNAPLSDSQIARKLARVGIIISRRTVTKYREQLNILPNSLRKKEKSHLIKS